ncbi:MAG: glycosyltransferase family 25 protein [Paracoccaceae bacterium]
MLPIHVINLSRRRDRLAAIGAALDRSGLPWRRVEAIDRELIGAAHLRADFGQGAVSRLFPATPGDMACSLTHQRLWGDIASARAEAAVVLEDDARVSDMFAPLMACDLAGLMRRHGMGLLKLEYWPGPQQSRRFPLGEDLGPVSADVRLYRMRSSFLGTCGYIITTEAARRLLDEFPHVQVPVDHLLFGREAGRAFPVLRPGFLNPGLVLHDVASFGSDIRDERAMEFPDGGKRPFARRVLDWRVGRQQEAELRRGQAERVQMRLADGTDKRN